MDWNRRKEEKENRTGIESNEIKIKFSFWCVIIIIIIISIYKKAFRIICIRFFLIHTTYLNNQFQMHLHLSNSKW